MITLAFEIGMLFEENVMITLAKESLEGATVWGFGGETLGNEDGVYSLFPFLRLADGRFFALRAPAEYSFLHDEAEAVECGTKIVSEAPIPYKSGTMLVVMGPCYAKRLNLLIEVVPTLGVDCSGFVDIQDGFRAKLMTLAEHERDCLLIHEVAMLVFDHEFIYEEEMLHLLSNTFIEGRAIEAALRWMIFSKLRGNNEQFEREVVLGAVRFGVAEADLRRIVDIRFAAWIGAVRCR